MGRAKRSGIDLEFDMEDGYYALGFAKGLAEGFSSKYYLTAVVEYAYAMMSADFNSQMLAVSAGKPWAFHHVYEPNHVGEPGFELWENRLYGRGEKRQASFEWRVSKLPIQTPEERLRNPDDPIALVRDEIDEEAWDALNEKRYIFRMRAPIMEYGLATTITPNTGTKALFIPTFKKQRRRVGSKKTGYHWESQNFRFSKINVPDFDYNHPQEPAIEGGTVGQFTAQWVAFWSGGGADASWQNHVRRGIEGSIDDWGAVMGKKVRGRKTRSGTAKIFSFNASHAAEESGRNLANAYLKKKARSFASASKIIDKYGVYGGQRI